MHRLLIAIRCCIVVPHYRRFVEAIHSRLTQIRVLSTDPEMSTLKRYEEESEEKLGQEAMAWNDGIASIFKDRIKAGKVSVFKNDFSKEVNAA